MANTSSNRKTQQSESKLLFQSKILTAIFGQSVTEMVIRVIFTVAAVGTLVVIAVGLLRPDVAPITNSTQTSAGHPVGLQVGNTAPDFTLAALDGKKVSLSDYRGKPVMLNFWYATCPGCLAEIPAMQKFYATQQAAGKDFTILGVNTVDDTPTAQQFVQHYGLTYQIVMDSNDDVVKLYNIGATPTSYFIDREGIIRSVVVGPVDDTALKQYVKQISNT
jgi:peroxiredoxin